jgi:hypothetical protein
MKTKLDIGWCKRQPSDTVGRMPECIMGSLPVRDAGCFYIYFSEQPCDMYQPEWSLLINRVEVRRISVPLPCEATSSVEVLR